MEVIDNNELELVTGGGFLSDLGVAFGGVAGQWLGKAIGGLFGRQGAAFGEQIGAAGGRAMGGTAGSMFEQARQQEQA